MPAAAILKVLVVDDQNSVRQMTRITLEQIGIRQIHEAENGKQEYTWQINDLLTKYHPNLVIVEAADAMGGYGEPQLPKAWIYDQSHALAMKIKAANATCIWVGPVYGDVNSPYHKADDRVRELSQFLSQSVAPCVYVDSLKFVSQPRQWPTTDGQHLTAAGYKAWGADIANATVRLSSEIRPH